MKVKNIGIIFFIVFITCGKNKESNIEDNKTMVLYPETGVYSVLKESSELVWLGKELSTKTHIGTINLLNGIVEVKENKQINGEIRIDMQTINVTDLKGGAKNSLEGHLSNEDFFNVQKYPEALVVFKSKNNNQLSNKINSILYNNCSNLLPFTIR